MGIVTITQTNTSSRRTNSRLPSLEYRKANKDRRSPQENAEINRRKAIEARRKAIESARSAKDMQLQGRINLLSSKRYSSRFEASRRSTIKDLNMKRVKLQKLGNEEWLSNVGKILGSTKKPTVTRRRSKR